jgi:hypothetical protein
LQNCRIDSAFEIMKQKNGMAVVLLLLISSISFGQVKTEHLVFADTNLEEGTADAYQMVEYKVLNVCKGKIPGETIRVAHVVGTAKDLILGQVVCRRVRTTDGFRTFAADLLKYDGILVPEEDLSDYIFEGFRAPCSCPVP